MTTTDDFVQRPIDQLLDYPLDMRWELTRRNPYYLALWKIGRDFHQNPTGDETTLSFGMAATLALSAIGVTGQPIPPETLFSEIGTTDDSFLCGALQPMTLRNFALLILNLRNPETLRFFANALNRCEEILRNTTISEDERDSQRLGLLQAFRNAPLSDLDCVFDIPLFFMHPEASLETIKDDTIRQAKILKTKRNLGSPKIHTAKIPNYLKVWDAIEGWSNGSYSIEKEMTFKQVAQNHSQRLSTVHEQYKQAFFHVVGSQFCISLWRKVIGRFKVNSNLNSNSAKRFRFLRGIAGSISPKKLVTETTLGCHGLSESEGVIQTFGKGDNNAETLDLAEQIMARIHQRQPVETIAQAMGWENNPQMLKMIQHIRDKDLDISKLMREQE